MDEAEMHRMQIALGHCLGRQKLRIGVNKIDAMAIQAISITPCS